MAPHCDPGFVEIFAGEELAWQLQLVDDATGDVEDLTGRPIAATLYRGDGTEIVSMLGTVVPGPDCHAAGVFPGSVTAPLRGQAALHLQLSELTGEDGRAVHADRPLRVKRAPATLTVPDEPGGVGAGGVRFTRHIAAGGSRLVVDRRGARGASAAEQLAGALDPVTHAPYIPAPTVDAMADWLRSVSTTAVDDAVDDAEAAAAYARAQGDAALAAAGAIADLVPAGAADRADEFNALLAGTKRDITLAPGDYHLTRGARSRCVTIADRTDLTLDGRGSRLIHDNDTDPTPHGQTLQLEGCVRTIVKGVRLGYKVSPSASGAVTEIADNRSNLVFLTTDEPPHFETCDRYVTQDERSGATEVAEYAPRDDDYDPAVNYTVTAIDGQAVGEPGRYRLTIPLIWAALARLVGDDDGDGPGAGLGGGGGAGQGDSDQVVFTTATPHGLPDGCAVTITGAGGLERDGVSIVNDLVLTASPLSPTSFRLDYGADEPLSRAGATAYVPGTGTVTMQRIAPETAIGDRILLWKNKHAEGPMQAYACKDVTIGTPGAPIEIDEAAGVVIKVRDIENLEINLRSRRGSAGCLIGQDVRGIIRGSIEVLFGGDDAIQIATGMWGRRMLGPFAPGSTVRTVAGATYLDMQFATSRTQQAGLTPPRLRDLIAMSEPTYNNLVATRMVTAIVPLDGAGRARVFFDGPLPAGFGSDWFVLNASCRPKYRLQRLIAYGGGRLFLPKTDDCEVDLIAGYGLQNCVVLARDPSSPVHPDTGGAAGGFRCRKLIAVGCDRKFGGHNDAVLAFRRAGRSNGSSDRPSDYWYDFDDAEIDGCGFGGVAVDGMNARFGRLTTARLGQLRASTPELQTIVNPGPSAYDFYANQGVCEIGTRNPYEAFSFHEGPGGFVFFPNGSLLVRETVIAAGALTAPAAKKVQTGHERRVGVWIDGHLQDPASYTCDDSTALTFAVPPLTTPGATARCLVEHVRC